RHNVVLTAAMLAELPADVLQELRETTLALDREATLQVIAGIEAQAPDTAAGLRLLVEDFQMGHIQDLLARMEQSNDNH
ncbi:MAG: hypothetical protein PVH03_01015, partial [Chloroflexota bacterium]